jgi:cell division transport system permease protein
MIAMSWQNLRRNAWLSIATTIMMGLILFIFNVIMVLNVLAQSSLSELGDKVDLLIYVDDSASVIEITELVEDVKSIPVVKTANYTSKDEALSSFLELYPDKSDPFTSYGIENPLPGNIQIVTDSPDQHELVIDYLNGSAYSEVLLEIESSNENRDIVARLLSVNQFTKKLILGVTITFIFGSLLMIMNAIHLSIFTRRREIQIMQLVGAKPSMIRFPFLFEGAMYSLGGVFFSLLLLVLFLEGTRLSQFTQFNAAFDPVLLFSLELVVSVCLGLISSSLALSYYLKRHFFLTKS